MRGSRLRQGFGGQASPRMTSEKSVTNCGVAKARQRRAHHHQACQEWWARLRLRSVELRRTQSLCPPDPIQLSNSFHRHCERSNPECLRGDSLDCFVATLLAMTSFSILAASSARVLPRHHPRKIGGRRECRAQAAPMARLQQETQAAVTTGSAKTSGIPCAMVLTAAPRSPWCTGLVSHHRSAIRPAELDTSVGVSGPHGLAVRISAPRRGAPTRPSHPASHVRDDRDTPLRWRRDAQRQSYISVKRKGNIFRERT